MGRQQGAFREMVKKETAAQLRWEAENAAYTNDTAAQYQLSQQSGEQPPATPPKTEIATIQAPAKPTPSKSIVPRPQAQPKPCGFTVINSGGATAIGVVVKKVDRGSIAEDAGLRVGDLVMYINNRPTRSSEEFGSVMNQTGAGNMLVSIKRGDNTKLKLTMARY